MKYKAIIFDLDGTAIYNDASALPTPAVTEAVRRAQKVMHVTCATGRPLNMALPIIEALDITEPCVISGGTQIYDPRQQKITWQKTLDMQTVKKVVDLCVDADYEVVINDEYEGAKASCRKLPAEVYVMFIMQLSVSQAEALLVELQSIGQISAHSVTSWNGVNFRDIHITHKDATKKNAIALLVQNMNLEQAEVIGVGDASNDLPLFESVGYKVAMGHAPDILKQAADYVTGTVEEDGLAQAIEKLVLCSNNL
jgi:5-amino-6-(5-phospho-D-ribitylamino)uracil phosphatase